MTDRTSLLITVQNPRPKEVAEGETVEFTIRREGGYVLEPLPIQVRIWEPNRAGLGGVNPTDEIHSFEFPAVPITADFVPSRGTTQRHSITVATLDDSDYEAQDSIRAEVVAVGGDLYKESRLRNEANILDNDRPDITLTADKTALGEGETVTFTLTRAVNTRIETTVGVAVDDPGGFLQGNSISDRVETPSSITFAPGEVTKTLAITPPEDWRDIPDSTLTFTVADEPHYTITADASIAVPVTDNDIAPQVSISFNQEEVNEGEPLILTVQRTGETKNPLEIPLTTGPADNQQYIVLGMDAGQSQLRITYNPPDDQYKGPDAQYAATLHPGPPEFWTATGVTTVTGTILDNDPYVVSVQALEAVVNEGFVLPVRISRNGHKQEALVVKYRISEEGDAIRDAVLGDHSKRIPAGSSSTDENHIAGWQDGSDGDLPEVSVGKQSDWVNEGDVVVFTLTRTGDTTDTLEVSLRLIKTRLKYDSSGYLNEQEEVALTIPAGASTLNVTRSTTDDIINSGDQTYVAVLLPGPYDTGSDANQRVWVQDDDRLTVTLTPATAEYTEGDRMTATLSRTGDTTSYLTPDVHFTITQQLPPGHQNRDVGNDWPFARIENGLATQTSIFAPTGRVEALGAEGRIWLVPDDCPNGSSDCVGAPVTPHYCLDDPGIPTARCGYEPQYLRGTEYEQTFKIYNAFMGVCMTKTLERPTGPRWRRGRRRPSRCTGTAGSRTT